MTRRAVANLSACAALAAIAATLGGCYEHVVKASGPNAGAYDVYEANDPDQKAVPRESRRYVFPNRNDAVLR